MALLITEAMTEHHQVASMVGKTVLPGHADSAIELNCLFCDKPGRTLDHMLSSNQLATSLKTGRFIRHTSGKNGHGGGQLQLGCHVHHAMLEHLKTADGLAELLAGLEEIQGQLASLLHTAYRLGALGGHGASQLIVQGCKSRTGLTQQSAVSHAHVLKDEIASPGSGHGGIAATLHTRR